MKENVDLNSTKSDFDLGRFAANQHPSQPAANWNFNQDFNFPTPGKQGFNFDFAVPQNPGVQAQESISNMVNSGRFNATMNDSRSSAATPVKKVKKHLDFQFEW